MATYMSLRERADRDFALARRKARLGRLGARLRRNDAAWQGLLCFEEVRTYLGTSGGVYRGPRTVPPGRIVGSVGRCEDFDGDFLPTKASVGERWKRMDLAFHRGEELPPVSLHKVGGVYFVSDGDHRVSVARYHGVEWIDAVVTEFRALLPRDRKVEDRPIRHHPSTGTERGGAKMYPMDPRLLKQMHEQMVRDAQRKALPRELRAARKRRAGWASALAWELKRVVGRLLKLLRP